MGKIRLILSFNDLNNVDSELIFPLFTDKLSKVIIFDEKGRLLDLRLHYKTSFIEIDINLRRDVRKIYINDKEVSMEISSLIRALDRIYALTEINIDKFEDKMKERERMNLIHEDVIKEKKKKGWY